MRSLNSIYFQKLLKVAGATIVTKTRRYKSSAGKATLNSLEAINDLI